MKGKDLSNTIIMEPIGDISDPENLNPDILGFMCGLEIHQQLDTGKLHSRMPSKLFDYKSVSYTHLTLPTILRV